MSEILEKLFHSKAEVKLLRLFFNNAQEGYLVSEAAKKSKISNSSSRREINNLHKIKLLIAKKKLGKTYYFLNPEFFFYNELKDLILKTNPASYDRIRTQVSKLGQIRFVVVSGVFINSEKGRADIMIVGEHISKKKLKNFLSNLEADVGKGINYVCMSTDEFRYRKGMFDKFVIDIIEGPHKIIIDKLKKV